MVVHDFFYGVCFDIGFWAGWVDFIESGLESGSGWICGWFLSRASTCIIGISGRS